MSEQQNQNSAAGGQSALSGLVMWRACNGMPAPIQVACPNGLYPAIDADGVQIYENTHFRSEGEAWEAIESNVLAGVSLAGMAVEYAQKQLREAEKQAAAATLEFKEFQKAKTMRRVLAT